ncbi:type II secretion system minor pseudopilin GspH [Achromobacter insolitus]|uniref:Type II secretion system protein H n=1 Tax=Achromobacter insolitus TaxID=217204 RepID=A0A6S7F092_9BURK|nr:MULTISPECIES: type II secretion system minor pseudopilin GspH [Achromobacter]AVG38886.1 type II secretion system protein GspH [Achromobacter insolitus]AXA69566.1 type II secretion system protein GspH [Achromobacter insolitus]MCP1403854.1 general secretion pathway protein H [Achromobacter insolitus]MDH3065159.1 type II secretion system minor pseudopilin GspH [Achromobacter insolitus]MEB3098614.1 type II secretion system minor pseudopilin GspH [Achromobacter sp. D10]
MPTSVPGNSERGFTLVEVLVVLVIVAIAASMVSLSVGRGENRLRGDAQRLADAFTVAQSEARSDGRPIRWLASGQGWSFERQGRLPGLSAEEDRPLPLDRMERDEVLRPQSWSAAPVELRLDPDQPLVFNTEWVAAPITLTLSAGTSRVILLRDAAGRYEIR